MFAGELGLCPKPCFGSLLKKAPYEPPKTLDYAPLKMGVI